MLIPSEVDSPKIVVPSKMVVPPEMVAGPSEMLVHPETVDGVLYGSSFQDGWCRLL